ncbi:MAG: Bug family tripartite tricarboxylate transporter substrate binding protein [Pigmentiphaga sp.]
MIPSRSACLLALSLAALVPHTLEAVAEPAYPTGPIHLIVPFPPGGPADVTARIVAEDMARRLGQPFVIENKGGAGGNIGAGAAAKAPADGYTLFYASGGTHGINPSLYRHIPYDPVTDFRGVALICTLANIFVAHPKFPANDIAGLIALAKANPGKIAYASAGNGTTTHMSAELLESVTGIDLLHIPYKGGGPAMNDLLGGHIELMVDGLPTSAPHIKSGRLKGLAVTSTVADSNLPSVPPVSATVPGYEAVAWFAIVAPAKTPDEIVNKLNEAANAALTSPEVRKRFAEFGTHPGGGTSQQLDAFITAELSKWRKVVEATGARVD